jgi:hypothetical protein
MKTILCTAFLAAALVSPTRAGDDKALSSPPNPHIDYPGFLEDAATVGKIRDQHRVTEDQFLQMMKEPGTVVFDARSDGKYRLLHVAGAKHLSLTDVTAEELLKVLPDKTARILIYCNNNFDKAPVVFAGKGAKASLNIYTFNTLYTYGYRNVFELGPFIDIHASKLPFEGTMPAR